MRGRAGRHGAGPLATALSVVAVALLAPSAPSSAATPPAGTPAYVADPAALVDPFAGTGTGPVNPGSVGEYPGAVAPFGMVQWSPDTTPERVPGSGYAYRDRRISGFSLTHLSGTGCPAYGDVPILPLAGPVPAVPSTASVAFSHADESASPGRYAVRLGGRRPVGVRLTVTDRTGLGSFTFPPAATSTLLFKLAGSANPVTAAEVAVGRDGVDGAVTSGAFCGTGTPYTLYFVARFDRPLAGWGTWQGRDVSPRSRTCTGTTCGAYLSFDTRHRGTVEMKVGVSFVSVAGAAANLAAEDGGWSPAAVERRTTSQWNHLLLRIRIGGGTLEEQRTFYTALYHSLLDPSLLSDVGGDYPGDDGQVHHSARPHYSNFSEWDIYRCEVPLLALVAPTQTGDIVQSLVDDAAQGGWLPKWAIPGGDASQMDGDSADPIIADAYAFGVHDFDVAAALAAMLKGAGRPESGHGLEIERQYLEQYLTQHYVNAASPDVTSIDYSIGGSATLEYALDDFTIARFAADSHQAAPVASLMSRAHDWEYLFDPATGYLGARNADGSFPPGPAFQRALLEPGGELGFEEGNAVQYTWAVPQDLAALAALMGGDQVAVARLDAFFTHLNAGRFAPYDWAGNEPGLWTPWEYDYFGAPWRTEQTVRRIATTLYGDRPVDEPGNDDLGALSSWYVWAALGLYPVTPGTADLALASPLFPRASIALPDGRSLRILAPGASAATLYVHRLVVATGTGAPAPSVRPWLQASVVTTGATLGLSLGRTPDRSWGAAPADAPPSYRAGRLPVVGFSDPAGDASLRPGVATPIELGLAGASGPGDLPEVTWHASVAAGLTVSPATGSLGGGRPTARLSLTATAAGTGRLTVSLTDADGIALPPVVLDTTATAAAAGS